MPDAKPTFWIDEVRRGNTEMLVIMFGAEPRGTIDVATYEEKVAWTKAVEVVNSMLQQSSSG